MCVTHLYTARKSNPPVGGPKTKLLARKNKNEATIKNPEKAGIVRGAAQPPITEKVIHPENTEITIRVDRFHGDSEIFSIGLIMVSQTESWTYFCGTEF